MFNYKAIGTFHLALSGAAFATILSLLQVPTLDIPLIIVLSCFSVTLPINIICGVVLMYKNENIIIPDSISRLTRMLGAVTTMVDFAGIFSLLIHFWFGFGLLFFVSGTIILMIVYFQIPKRK